MLSSLVMGKCPAINENSLIGLRESQVRGLYDAGRKDWKWGRAVVEV